MRLAGYSMVIEVDDDVLDGLEGADDAFDADPGGVLEVAGYGQDTTGISIARIVRELRGLQEVTINLNGRHLAAAPRLTDTANDILTALSTPPPAH